MFTILICKLAAYFGHLLGRGSSMPGAIALKINRKILSSLRLPPLVIAVTGSNGKTSTTELISYVGRKAGLNVISNDEGSNQIEGIATTLLSHSTLGRRVVADAVVLECDERFCQHIFKHFTPSHIVITNLYRDQLTRNGSSEFVAHELRKGLRDRSVLIVNADEPRSLALSHERDSVIRFSVSAQQLREDESLSHVYDDGYYCPVCQSRLVYSYRILGHLGRFACPSCGLGNGEIHHEVSDVRGDEFILNNEYAVRPQVLNAFYAYNIAAAYATVIEALQLSATQAAEILSGYQLNNQLIDRIIDFTLFGHKGRFLLSKHENSMSWNGSIETVLASDSTELSVVLIVDQLSRKIIANDMSWLWDIDFERLCDDRVKRIVVSGQFAEDVAVRLLFAGVDNDRITVMGDLDRMMETIKREAQGDIALMTCFTDIDKFLQRMKKEEGETQR